MEKAAKKIPLDRLRSWWEDEGIHGSWREKLRVGYAPGETYFELGLMPEKERKYGDYRIVLDHSAHVRLCPPDIKLRGEYVIRPDESKRGAEEVDPTRRYHDLFVGQQEYDRMLEDAACIYAEYADENIVCFWSIPNKWFEDLALVQFLTQKIVQTEDYRDRVRTRESWYWP